MSVSDRAKEALLALLGMGTPRVDYFTTYRARVVKQSGDLLKVDIIPDDSRIPQRQDVTIKWGIPGVTAQISPGAFVHHGWEGGDPSKPYVMLCESGATVVKLVLDATMVYVGGESGAKALATKDDFDNHTHLAGSLTSPAGTAGGPVTGTSGAPVMPATGTLNTKAK